MINPADPMVIGLGITSVLFIFCFIMVVLTRE